ncbi:hemophore-related protein [Mycolicibacterium cosmeticum]|jgi:hemophore-related protein|nr:hemophore-related protein [Mycolicibacterium cosmeticum]
MSFMPNPRMTIVALAAGSLLSAGAATLAPTASAAPVDCSRPALDATVQQTTGAAQGYLNAHPGANQAVSAIYTQPRDVASANIRAYFNANPQEYYDLRGILAPIGDKQRACNTQVLSPELASAYSEFMAG